MCSNIQCDVFRCKILESKQDDRRRSRRSAARSSDHSSLPRRCSHPAPVPNFSIDGDDLVGAACPSSRAEELSIDALSIYLILPKFLLPFLKIFFSSHTFLSITISQLLTSSSFPILLQSVRFLSLDMHNNHARTLHERGGAIQPSCWLPAREFGHKWDRR